MKLKLDENFPASAKPLLLSLGHEIHTVHDEGLGGAPDDQLWRVVEAEGRLLLTRDTDFTDRRALYSRDTAGVVVFRLTQQGRGAVLARLEEVADQLESWQGSQVIVSDERVRVRGLPPATVATSEGG